MWGKPSASQLWLDALQRGVRDPATLLDSLEGGYILGVAMAFAIPVVRAGLDRCIYQVKDCPKDCSC